MMKIKSKLLELGLHTEITDNALESFVGTRVNGMPGVVTRAWVEDNWVMIEIDLDDIKLEEDSKTVPSNILRN